MAFSRAGHASHVARQLTDIVKLPLLKKEPTSKIAEIWRSARRPLARADVPLPVFRGGGHFLLLSQFQNRRHFLFTFLEDYKKNPAFSRPYVTLTLHDDLAKEKDIVLLRGDVEKQMLKEEADHVIAQVVESYCIASRYSSDSGPLTFNQRPNDFDLDAMLKHDPKPPVNIETP
ncbi:ATP11 protein [Aureococcus anophagefferens]|nr:ATP11 protein [Aureococcus anophagefferens]